jgi:epoxide hydrolase 4
MSMDVLSESWYGWRKQIPALVEAGCRVIVPDQRGYNLSDKPEDVKSYHVSSLVEDILGLINALEYEKVNLVGHDWGAGVAWTLANKYPERLQRLGILNVPHPAVMRRFLLRDFEQIRRSWYVFLFQLPWLPETGLKRDDWRGLIGSLRNTSKPNSFTDEDILKYKEAWSQPGALTAMINWYRALIQQMPKLPDDPRILVRTLMMWGLRDFALSHRMARPSMDYVNDGNLILFPEATHWLHLDAAEEVNHYLIDFLLDKISKQVIR